MFTAKNEIESNLPQNPLPEERRLAEESGHARRERLVQLSKVLLIVLAQIALMSVAVAEICH